MATLLCDAIGCGKPAAWVRTQELDASHEDFLCNACWAKLRVHHPEQAAYYIVCDLELAVSAPDTEEDEDILIE